MYNYFEDVENLLSKTLISILPGLLKYEGHIVNYVYVAEHNNLMYLYTDYHNQAN